jgi:probable HAF family extracellular repeat protein
VWLSPYWLAVALIPAVTQQSFRCSPPPTGDTTLAVLELEVAGENQIAFDPQQRMYDVSLPAGTDTAILVALSTDPAARLWYDLTAATPPPLDGGVFPTGGGEVTLDGVIPEGESTLRIYVRAPGGASGTYQVNMSVGAPSFMGLGDLPGGIFHSIAWAVSADGKVAVGQSRPEAFRWENGLMVGLGDLPGGALYEKIALAVSADGSVVAGRSDTAVYEEAFRWTESDGMVGLGNLGNFDSVATAVSADGSVIVGYSRNAANAEEAFRWTESGGMVSLGDLPGQGFRSQANAVSADGSVVVGDSADDPIRYGTNDHAFIWDEMNGIQNLKKVLLDKGLDLSGWELFSATGVSADGRTVVGFGVNPAGDPEGWIAYLGSS